jgi:hypothetical protein
LVSHHHLRGIGAHMMLRRGQLKTPVTSWSHSDGRKTKGYDVKDDIQKTSNATLDATNHSFERVTKATQAIVSEIADYSKRSFETGTKTMENLFGAKSLDKAIEVQSEYAKTAYEGYVTHARRLGELYINLATEAFKPYEGLLRK